MTLATDAPHAVRAVESDVRPVWIAGAWTTSTSTETFRASNPATAESFGSRFPVSGWAELDVALSAAVDAGETARAMPDLGHRLAQFFESYAAAIEAAAPRLAEIATQETALPAAGRFVSVEIPRTVRQLRLAAAAARGESWREPTIDTQNDIRSCFAPIGPVFVIGPNNFPFAFNGISGGDFAAALAAGNPVIAKGHPLHPNTTYALAELAADSVHSAGLPVGMSQLVHHLAPADGLRLIADRRIRAVAFTGSREVGVKLKDAADRSGTLFYGEMSSLNPVVILPGALAASSESIADQLATSLLTGTGQFCTKPGLVLLIESSASETFIAAVAKRLDDAPAGVLFSKAGAVSLQRSIDALVHAGARRRTLAAAPHAAGYRVANTLLSLDAASFLRSPETFQTEMFGSATLVVSAKDSAQLCAVIEQLEGNLTGSIYSASTSQEEDALYDTAASRLRGKVGRLMNDKMPTGVLVSPAMNHGGPFPASSHPHFTAVGLPQSIRRFTQLECYDRVRAHRLPACLQDNKPSPGLWRQIDGAWTQS